MKNIAILLFLAVAALFSPVAALCDDDGKLGDFEGEVEDGDDGGSAGSSEFALFMAEFLVRVAPELLFYFEGEDSLFYDGKFWTKGYSHFPYETSEVGMYSYDSDKWYSLSLGGGIFYESFDISSFELSGRFMPAAFLGLEFNSVFLYENISGRRQYSLTMYDLHLNYQRVRADRFSLWWGAGFRMMIGEKSNGGFSMNLGAACYLTKPISLSGAFRFGWINSVFVDDYDLNINFHIKRAQLYVGYKKYVAGASSLDGLRSGFIVWF